MYQRLKKKGKSIQNKIGNLTNYKVWKMKEQYMILKTISNN